MPDGNFAPYEAMSPTLLAAQPVTFSTSDALPDPDWDLLYADLESALSSYRAWRWSWWAYWGRLAEYFLPKRYHWVVTSNKMSKGNPVNDAIIDGTATQAVKTCAAGLWSGLTSPSRPWFRLGIGLPWVNLDAEGTAWLEDTEQRLYTVLAQSNFYTTMAQFFQDMVVFGTSPIITYEDFETVVRYYLPCAGEYFLAVGSRMSVDTLFREFTMTAKQIIEMFTLENCPPDVQGLWAAGGGSIENEFVVCHAIRPNYAIARRGGRGGSFSPVSGKYAYLEVYWLKGHKSDRPLSKKGFTEKPFVAGRWATVSNDPYGSDCPGMNALGDNKQVQLETRRKAEFIEKGVRPPMGANPEMKNEPSSIIPGNITYTNTTNGAKGFWPLFEPSPVWLGGLVADIDKVNARIEKFMFVDVFMAISQMEGVQPRNELELTKRDLERLQKLGPFIQNFEEVADELLQRTLDIMRKRNMLKPMPASLQNVPLKISYISIMTLAQKSSGSVAMKDVFATMGALSSAAKAAGVPDPLRVINLDKSARKYADLANYPSDCLFTNDEVTQHDAIRAKAQQQAQVPGQAMAAVQAAHTLSQTQLPGGNSALGAMLPGVGGGQ